MSIVHTNKTKQTDFCCARFTDTGPTSDHRVWCLTMVEPSKCPVSSKRHAQLITSSSHLSKKHSKHDLNSTERVAHSLVQARSARRDETISSSPTQKDVASVSVVRKLTVSRRRISSIISPQATPRIRRKDDSEKENVKVQNDVSIRQTIGRSVSAATLRRAPVPLVNVRSLRARNSQVISGSANSDIVRLPRSTVSSLSGEKSVSVLPQRQVSPKNRNALSLENSARTNCDIAESIEQIASGHWFPVSEPVAAAAGNENIPTGSVVIPSGDTEGLSVSALPRKLDSDALDRIISIATEDTGALHPPSSLNGFTASAAELSGLIEYETFPESFLEGHLSLLSSFPDPSDEMSRLESMSNPISIGNPFRSAEDGEDIHPSDERNNFELADIPTVSESHHKSGTKKHSPRLRPASKINTNKSNDNLGMVCSVSRNMYKETLLSSSKPEPTSELKCLEKPKSPESVPTVVSESDFSDATGSSEGRNQSTAGDSVIARSQTCTIYAPSTPPPTPVHGLSPSPSVSIAVPILTTISSLPPSIFPRLYTELAPSYAHLGLGTRSTLNSTVSTRRAIENPQAEKTQEELARLRAGGSGSVLARARVFGQTLWSRSSQSQKQGVVTAKSSDTSLGYGVQGSEKTQMHEMGSYQIQVSESGSVKTPPPPTSPVPASPNSIANESADNMPSPQGQGKRTLGCTNLMRAVVMAQRLWSTKNFVLE
ncbi:hypothetical protein ACEPAF_5739 [Sanghuangporus sanghuang]